MYNGDFNWRETSPNPTKGVNNILRKITPRQKLPNLLHLIRQKIRFSHSHTNHGEFRESCAWWAFLSRDKPAEKADVDEDPAQYHENAAVDLYGLRISQPAEVRLGNSHVENLTY